MLNSVQVCLKQCDELIKQGNEEECLSEEEKSDYENILEKLKKDEETFSNNLVKIQKNREFKKSSNLLNKFREIFNNTPENINKVKDNLAKLKENYKNSSFTNKIDETFVKEQINKLNKNIKSYELEIKKQENLEKENLKKENLKKEFTELFETLDLIIDYTNSQNTDDKLNGLPHSLKAFRNVLKNTKLDDILNSNEVNSKTTLEDILRNIIFKYQKEHQNNSRGDISPDNNAAVANILQNTVFATQLTKKFDESPNIWSTNINDKIRNSILIISFFVPLVNIITISKAIKNAYYTPNAQAFFGSYKPKYSADQMKKINAQREKLFKLAKMEENYTNLKLEQI